VRTSLERCQVAVKQKSILTLSSITMRVSFSATGLDVPSLSDIFEDGVRERK